MVLLPFVFIRGSGSQVSPVVNPEVVAHVAFVHLLECFNVITLPLNSIVGPIEYAVFFQHFCEMIKHNDSSTS